MRYYRPTRLTEREEQILVLRGDGMQGKEIADLLGISHNTVRAHQFHAKRKLGVRTTLGAIRKVNVMRFRLAHNV